MRQITTTLNNILSLISCAQDYGFEDDVLFGAFAEMIGFSISDVEIDAFLQAGEFSPEDRRILKNRIVGFREKYCSK